MMVLIRFWRSLAKKEGVESAKYEKQFLSTFTPVLGRFFTDPDPDFRPIRTQEKNSDPDPGKEV